MQIGTDTVALVTGSTRGIGKAIAIELAKLNYSVIINGASTSTLSENYTTLLNKIYRSTPNRFLFIKADISNSRERSELISEIKSKFKKIDILVNNAGVAPRERKDLLKASEDEFERVLRINLQGPYFLTQAIANWMVEIKKEKKDTYNPYIINISSISSYAASPNRGE